MTNQQDIIIQTFDLLPLVEADVALKRSGAWWIGPCPFCGGEDRFNLHSTHDGWRWFCRHCGDGRYHDAANYIMRRENLGYGEALKRMGADQPNWRAADRRNAELLKASEERIPPATWQQRGRAYAEECRQNLWRPAGEKALAYLRGRGLTAMTIAKYQLGYNPTERDEPLEVWGLEGDGKVHLERGITMPCIGIGGLYYIKTRLPLPAGAKGKKYTQVRGGKLGLYGWGNMQGAWLAIMTEGEFDCMILDQLAGDLAAICTLGAANNSPATVNPELLRWVYRTDHVLACYDNDEAGRNGMLALQERLASVRMIHLPDEYHDINDAHLAGLDLADWVCRESERLEIVRKEQNDEPV